MLGWLKQLGFTGRQGIDAAGHRVVHGGDRFVEPTLIDSEAIEAIEALEELVPLHNASAFERYRGGAVRAALPRRW